MAIKKPVYEVTITETLVKTVYVEAWSPAAARECVEHLYCDLGDIVLTSDDYNGDSNIDVSYKPVAAEPDYFANDNDSRRII